MFDLPKICHPHCSLLDYATSLFKRSSCKCLIRACCSFSPVLATESTSPAHYTGKTLWPVVSAHFHISFLSISLSFSLFLSVFPYVGQCMCIDIFSVYRSPESRIGDHPRNRLSHFYVLKKWSGQVLSSISLSLTGSPPYSLFHTTNDEEPSRTRRASSSVKWTEWATNMERRGQLGLYEWSDVWVYGGRAKLRSTLHHHQLSLRLDSIIKRSCEFSCLHSPKQKFKKIHRGIYSLHLPLQWRGLAFSGCN